MVVNTFVSPPTVFVRALHIYIYIYIYIYCKTHYHSAPFNFTHFALGDDNANITSADIRSKKHNNAPSSGDTVDARNKMAAIRFRCAWL